MIEKFKNLLREIIEAKIPDLHISSFQKAYIRKHNWDLEQISSFWDLTQEDIELIIHEIVWDKWLERFKKELEMDCSYSLDDARFRVNIFQDYRGYSIALRYIPKDIPSLEQLWIEQSVINLLDRQKWLILVTWPTGHWKSTTLASMINYINAKYKKHIITIEDPIEFNFKNNLCHINQREVGIHTSSFARAIRSTLREDPDVVMVWEMRDPETMQAALTLAETWHLVLSTLHTNDAVQSIDRIIDSFPEWSRDQIRSQLWMSLTWVISQMLVPRADWVWRVAAREIMINNDAIRNLISRGLTTQMYSIIEISTQNGMMLMDKSLMNLFEKWFIDRETCVSRLRDKDFQQMLAK